MFPTSVESPTAINVKPTQLSVNSVMPETCCLYNLVHAVNLRSQIVLPSAKATKVPNAGTAILDLRSIIIPGTSVKEYARILIVWTVRIARLCVKPAKMDTLLKISPILKIAVESSQCICPIV